MAKLTAAKKKQISETLKRRWAERKANANPLVVEKIGDGPLRIRGGKDGDRAGLNLDVAGSGGGSTSYTTSIPTTESSRLPLATDIINILTSNGVGGLILVRVVERILRP